MSGGEWGGHPDTDKPVKDPETGCPLSSWLVTEDGLAVMPVTLLCQTSIWSHGKLGHYVVPLLAYSMDSMKLVIPLHFIS